MAPSRPRPALLDGGEPRRRGDLVEQVAGLRVGRLRQHRQRRPRHGCRRGAAGKLVGADHLALAVAGMRPVDRELPRSERAEAFDHDASAPRDRPDRCRDTSAARRAAGTAPRRARSRLPWRRRRGARGRARTARGSARRGRPPAHRREPPRSHRRRSRRDRRRSSGRSRSARCGPTTALRLRRRSASASPARSTACSRSAAAGNRSPAWPGGRRCAPASDAAPDAAGTLPARSSCRSPDRASSRRRCRRRRRREWSRAASVPAGRSARSPAR